MKSYNYKMQWLLPINGNAIQSKSEGKKTIINFINAVGGIFKKIIN